MCVCVCVCYLLTFVEVIHIFLIHLKINFQEFSLFKKYSSASIIYGSSSIEELATPLSWKYDPAEVHPLFCKVQFYHWP